MPDSDSTESSSSTTDSRPPVILHVIAAIAWLLAAFSFVAAADRSNNWSDVTFFVGLGGWSAYLGLALPRGIAYAWVACRGVAFGTVGVNLLLACGMAAVLIADAAGLRSPAFNVPLEKTLAYVGFAIVMTVVPLAVYRALGRASVKRWCGLEDEDGLPVAAAG